MNSFACICHAFITADHLYVSKLITFNSEGEYKLTLAQKYIYIHVCKTTDFLNITRMCVCV